MVSLKVCCYTTIREERHGKTVGRQLNKLKKDQGMLFIIREGIAMEYLGFGLI